MPKPEQPNLDQPDSNSDIPSVSPQKGEIKTFEYDGLVLTVSNVREIKQRTSFDGMETWTYDIYVVYPGAMVTVLDAAMMNDISGSIAHADWAVYTSADERVDIIDDMEPFEVTSDILGIFDPESSTYVLGFEVYSEAD